MAVITCLWERTFTSQVWGHYLVESKYRCWKNDCVFGSSEFTKTTVSFESQDTGRTTIRKDRQTTAVTWFGAEDDTNDILCKLDGRLPPW
jgi:hypothetical protein